MTISLCKHSFPVLPPAGSLAFPGPCTGCGLTFTESEAELKRQADAIRLRTAHEGQCHYCGKTATVFQFQREQQAWDLTEPPVRWLCVPCWGDAQATVETTGFSDFHDAFDRGTDDQLARFVFGGAA